jgi:hypothetical protein
MEPNKLHKLLHNAGAIGDISLVSFTLIDMTLAIVFFASLSVDTATAIALCFFGVMASIGKIWARIEGEKTMEKVYFFVWIGFTAITFFGGVCFMMTTVQIGSDAPPKPQYVIIAENEYNESKATLVTLQKEQKEFLDKNQRTNAATYDQRIADENAIIDDKNIKLTAANDRLKSEWSGSSDKIKALSVFNRLPLIMTAPSAALIIALIFFSIGFGTLETVIFVMAGKIGKEGMIQPTKKGRPAGSKNKREIEIEDFEKFISANWIGLRTSNNSKILSQASFMEFYDSRGGFPVWKYKYIKQLAIDREIITPGDEIIIKNEDEALEAML